MPFLHAPASLWPKLKVAATGPGQARAVTVTAALSGGAANATNTTKCTIHEPQLQCFADVTESRVRPV